MLNYYAFVLILNSLLNCNVCFETGNIPSCWAKIIITPLPKSGGKGKFDHVLSWYYISTYNVQDLQ